MGLSNKFKTITNYKLRITNYELTIQRLHGYTIQQFNDSTIKL